MYQLDCAVWETTLACNMHCTHCGSNAGQIRKKELNTKECFKVSESLANINCQVVSLMGGEPFLRKDWQIIARCVKDLSMEVAWVSNGLLIPKYISKISRIEPLVIGLSLDGMEKTHDSIRKPGSFESCLEAIDVLHDSGIQTTIITTVSKLNIFELPKMRKLLESKAVNWQIQCALPFGNFSSDYLLTPDQYYKICNFIITLSHHKKRKSISALSTSVIGSHGIGYYSHKYQKRTEFEGCTAGIKTLGITSDGNIVGCLAMGNNRYFEGNIRDRSLEAIWKDPNSFSYNRKFDETKIGDNCKTCSYFMRCKGGCEATSISLTNSFHNTPFCMRQIELDQL